MFGIDKNAFMLLGQIIPKAFTDHTWFGLPFATQKYENGTAFGLELVVEQIALSYQFIHIIVGTKFGTSFLLTI